MSIEMDIRSHLNRNDEAQDQIAWHEIQRRSGKAGPTEPRPQFFRGARVAVAAAVVTLLLGALTALLFNTDAESPVVTQPPTTLPSTRPAESSASGFGKMTISPSATLQPVLDPSVVELPVTASASTASPIGEISWTVHEVPDSSDTSQYVGFRESSPELSDVTEFITSSGIQLELRGEVMVDNGTASIENWSFGVDWQRTLRDDQLFQQETNALTDWVAIPDAPGSIRFEGITADTGRRFELDDAPSVSMHVELADESWTVHVTDGTGDSVGSISGALPFDTDEEVLNALANGHEFYLATGAGQTRVVEPGWPAPSPDAPGILSLYALGSEMFALASAGPGVAGVWESEDGLTWDQAATLELPDPGLVVGAEGEPAEPVILYEGVRVAHDIAIAQFWNLDQVYRVWISDNGVDWRVPVTPPTPTGDQLDDEFGNTFGNPNGHVHAVESGWVWISGFETDLAIWVSEDAENWVDVDLSELPLPHGSPPEFEFIEGWADGRTIVYWFGKTVVVGEIG